MRFDYRTMQYHFQVDKETLGVLATVSSNLMKLAMSEFLR